MESEQQSGLNLQNYCRTCGSTTGELISIFDDEGLGYELNIKISTYLDLELQESDILPLSVCIECTSTLLSFHKLYISCMKTKERFEAILQENEKISTNLSDIPIRRNDFDIHKTIPNNINQYNSTKYYRLFGLHDTEFQIPTDEQANNQDTADATVNACQPDSPNGVDEEKTNLTCQHCTKQFRNKNVLIDHLKDVHTDLIFLCDVCKDYIPRSELLTHMTSHALSLERLQLKNEEFKCEKCNRIFRTDKKYQNHLKTVHQKPTKSFKCLDCDKTFNTNRVLRNHINYKHSNNRKYKCDHCQKSFKTDSGLYAHRKTHTERYDYSCQICLKQFKFKVHLSRHLTMHSQEKNYFCLFCSKSFGVKDNLNKHLKTHYKLFEFKCHICEFLTSQRRYLAMHMKTTHLKKM